jgi:hypothetical protein
LTIALGLLLLLATAAAQTTVVPLTISSVDSDGGEPQVFLPSGGGILIGDGSGLHRSTNNGTTWTDVTPHLLFSGGCGFQTPVPSAFCDGWVMAQDAGGELYATTTNGPSINIITSTNNGASWNVAANLAAGADAVADRPWLTATTAGHVTVIWNSNGQLTPCAASTDGALTFVRSAGTAGVIAGSVETDSTGALVFAVPGVAYHWPNNCAAPGLAQGAPLPAHGSGGAQLQSAVDSSDRIYLPQPMTNSSAMQVVGINGWGGSMKTINVTISGVGSMTMPAVAASGNQVAVSFYGSSSTGDPSSVPSSATWNVYLIRITNFWNASPTITTTKVTTSSVHSGPICLAGINCSSGRELWDYQSAAIDSAGAVHLAWTHDPSGVSYTKVP